MGFKYGAGYTLVLTGTLNLPQAGLYLIRVLGYPKVQLFVNGAAGAGFPATATSRVFVVWAASSGLFDFDLVVADPRGPLDVLMQSAARPGEA